MSGALPQRVRYETLRSLAYTSISGTYAGVGTAFANPVRLIKVNNTTDANLIISFDGVNAHDFVFAQSAYVFDYASNKEGPVDKLEQSVGDRVYVKEESGSPSKGNVYVTVVYASPS